MALVLLTWALLVAGAAAEAQAEAPAPPAEAQAEAQAGSPAAPMMAFPLDRLRPGLTGHGFTEMPGGVVERFEVTVVALQHDLGPGFPLVLVRLHGDVVDATGGVAAGMSGSPVYLPLGDATALLGGIGYVFPESDPSLALVTPIDTMRAQTAGTRSAGPPAGAVPVATPLLVGGLGPRAVGLLQRTVLDRSAFGLVAVQAGGAAPAEGVVGALTAGSAAAAQLVRGDLTISVVGTVTEVHGDEVLAFAHAFLGGGPASWPLVGADVTAVVPSRVVPFKLANVGRTIVGTVVEDRPAGVRATLGASPDLIPVTLTVTVGSAHRVMELEVAADERLWPALVAVAALEAVDRTWQRVGPGTADVAWEIALPDGSPLRLSESAVSADDLATAAAFLVMAPLALLAENAFAAARPTSLRLAVTVDEGRRDSAVVELLLEEPLPTAGGVLGVVVRLQPWRRAGEVRTHTLRLPPDLDGELELRARGGAEPRDDDETFDDDPLRSYGELIEALRDREQGADLVFEVRRPGGSWRELDRLALRDVIVGARTTTLHVEASADRPTDQDGRGTRAP